MDAEGLRDGRAGDVRVEHGGLMAAALHFAGEQAGDEGLSDAALAGNDCDDLIDSGPCAQRLEQGLRLALGAAFAAGRAIVGAIFAHVESSVFYNSCFYYTPKPQEVNKQRPESDNNF